jgi:hypothetical protein
MLAATEVKRRLAMSHYSQLEVAQVKTDMRMTFAVGSEESIQLTSTQHIVQPSKRKELRMLMSYLPGLRCRPGYSCFNIYPTTEITLKVNTFLWETVQAGFYDSMKGNAIFGDNVFVLGLPAELYNFLVHVSLAALDVAMIDFLVLLHHQLTTDDDAIGVAKLREELLPKIWNRVEANIGVFDNGEPREAERAATLEHLVQISFMTPWRVDILAGYLSQGDMTTLIDKGPFALSASLPSFGADSVGVRGSALMKMYRDWRVYDEVLCQRLRMKRNAALEAMDRAVHCGRSGYTYEQTAAVVDLSYDQSSWFSRLPIEVIERSVVPWVVRRCCETIPPRKRHLATLKSLLELSSKFFVEDENAQDNESMDETDIGSDFHFGANPMQPVLESGVVQVAPIHVAPTLEDFFALTRIYPTASGEGEGISPASSDGSCTSFHEDNVEVGEYPLDADPPRYSRMERHGGLIDLSIMPNTGQQAALLPFEAPVEAPLGTPVDDFIEDLVICTAVVGDNSLSTVPDTSFHVMHLNNAEYLGSGHAI